MGPIFLLSLRQLAGRWRLLLILLLAALPVAAAALVSWLAKGEADYEQGFINTLLDGMLVGGIVPIVTMVLATAAFGNEIEDHTLSYLALNPIHRWQIALPKLVASIVISGPLLIASGVGVTLLGPHSSAQAALAVGVAMLAGVVAYVAVFTWAGLISAHALGFALVYVLLWEGVISTFLDGVRYLSVRSYTLAILHGIDGESFNVLSQRVIEFPAAVVGAVAVTGAFVWLTVRHLRRMDVP